MKHLLITRLWFDNKDLMDKYIAVSVKTFVPAMKSQTCNDFELGILIRSEHVDYVKEKIGIDFTAFIGGMDEFRGEVLKNKYDIQSRVDFDDWVNPDYIQKIQKIYNDNISKYKSFVIHAQPEMMDWPSKKITKVGAYHDTRISMFSTLCQRDPINPVYSGSHGQMWKMGEKVFKLPDGMARWVQHPDTVTRARNKAKNKAKNITKVGNMKLYDLDHNWISENNIDPVLNVLTRTFKRPVSFKECRDSVLSQTYCQGDQKFNFRSDKINHIVGSEVECDYCDAILFTPKKGALLPWNLHMNDLGDKVKSGWVMYLDDDDKFLYPEAVSDIMSEAIDEDTMLLWRVKIGDVTVPNDKCWGKEIKAGQISGIGFAFHSKHLPVPWMARRMGDFHVISTLQKKLKLKWIDKFCTGTQGKKNNHGKVPLREIKNPAPKKVIAVKSKDIQKGLVSVGTPTWNNKGIFWLSIEGLCRQKTDYPWEYIINECPSENMVGEDFIRGYQERLKAAGCVRIVYINNGRRTHLSTKWKQIAAKAQGEVLILHDSDDYTHPGRIQKTMELIGDKPWYDTRFAWHYSIPDHKMMLYDYQITKNRWKTGFNIAIRTEVLRSIPDPIKNKGMHKWMCEYVKDKYIDEKNYACFATTGANTVSLNRRRHFDHPQPPFVKTNNTIHDIGIPEDVIDRLQDIKPISALEIHRGMVKVEVEFLKDYCRLYKKEQIKRIPIDAYYKLLAKGHVRLTSEEILEPIITEL